MLKRMAALLRKFNGADYVGRRVDALADTTSIRMAAVEKRLGDLSLSLEHHLEWQCYLGFDAPLFILDNGRLALNRTVNDAAERVMLISIPKSGTYLMSAVLEKLGMVNVGLHVWETGFHDYRGKTIPEMVHRYSEFAGNAPLQTTADLVMPGQFMVGHVGANKETKETLAPFKRFLTVRELRQCFVSHMRFFMNDGRGIEHGSDWKVIEDPKTRMRAFLEIYAEELLTWTRRVSAWLDDPGLLRVPFECVVGDMGQTAQKRLMIEVATHINLPLSEEQAGQLISGVLNRPTKTWSGQRSSLDEYWDESCEKIFVELGGVELNSLLRYSE